MTTCPLYNTTNSHPGALTKVSTVHGHVRMARPSLSIPASWWRSSTAWLKSLWNIWRPFLNLVTDCIAMPVSRVAFRSLPREGKVDRAGGQGMACPRQGMQGPGNSLQQRCQFAKGHRLECGFGAQWLLVAAPVDGLALRMPLEDVAALQTVA